MKSCILFILSAVMGVFFNVSAVAESRKPLVGKKAAQKYFQSDVQDRERLGNGERYFNIHLGGFTDSVSYAWNGQRKVEGLGRRNYGVTYLLDNWTRGMDLSLRVELTSFYLEEEDILKMSLLPLITFPQFKTGFPLYLGFGIGPGVFFKQLSESSNLSLDYQLVFGVRMIDVLGSMGFFVESGLKNHLHLLSEGQFNGLFVSIGAVFTF